jgi:CRP-like cAMP-binding protein
MPKDPTTSPNRVLARLSSDEIGLLQPHLEAVDLPVRKQLENRNKTIEHVYFIEHGFASVVANGTGHSIEVGLIGREGMTGLAVLMGTDRSPHETFMQAAGDGQRISSAELRSAMEQSPALHRSFLRYGHAFVVQTAQTALANGRNKVEERLARWLLMAHDRLDSDEVPLTHEFLSVMLGVRRPGVTVTLDFLEKEGPIRAKRGAVAILNRTGLRKISIGAYGVAEAEFQRLFG